jgi:hypothetical protein
MQQRIQWWVLGSGVLMLIGAFGPWVTVLGISVSGTDGSNDGWLVVAVAAIGGGLYYAMRRRRDAGVWPLLGGLAGLAVTAYDRENLQAAGVFAGVLQVGWGLNLALIASVSMAVAGVFAIIQARRSAPAAVPPATAPAEQPAGHVEQAATEPGEPSQWPPPPGWARTPRPESAAEAEPPSTEPPTSPESGS